jgi:hypothetical protein
MDFSAKSWKNQLRNAHSGRFSSPVAEKTVRNTSIYAVLATLLAFSSAVHADQASVGPVIGVATVTIIEQECVSPGNCDIHAFLTQKLVLNGSTFTRETKCTGFQGATDAYNSSCGPAQWLGNCTKTAVPYSSRGKSGTVNGTVYYCNNDHTGNCQSVTGHFDPLGRVLMDSISSTGGCQY